MRGASTACDYTTRDYRSYDACGDSGGRDERASLEADSKKPLVAPQRSLWGMFREAAALTGPRRATPAVSAAATDARAATTNATVATDARAATTNATVATDARVDKDCTTSSSVSTSEDGPRQKRDQGSERPRTAGRNADFLEYNAATSSVFSKELVDEAADLAGRWSQSRRDTCTTEGWSRSSSTGTNPESQNGPEPLLRQGTRGASGVTSGNEGQTQEGGDIFSQKFVSVREAEEKGKNKLKATCVEEVRIQGRLIRTTLWKDFRQLKQEHQPQQLQQLQQWEQEQREREQETEAEDEVRVGTASVVPGWSSGTTGFSRAKPTALLWEQYQARKKEMVDERQQEQQEQQEQEQEQEAEDEVTVRAKGFVPAKPKALLWEQYQARKKEVVDERQPEQQEQQEQEAEDEVTVRAKGFVPVKPKALLWEQYQTRKKEVVYESQQEQQQEPQQQQHRQGEQQLLEQKQRGEGVDETMSSSSGDSLGSRQHHPGYHGRDGLYIGRAVLKNNVFVLDFVPDLGTADSDAIVNFTDWTHPPDLDPDFSPGGFCSRDTIDSSRDNIGSSRDNIGSSRNNIGSSNNGGPDFSPSSRPPTQWEEPQHKGKGGKSGGGGIGGDGGGRSGGGGGGRSGGSSGSGGGSGCFSGGGGGSDGGGGGSGGSSGSGGGGSGGGRGGAVQRGGFGGGQRQQQQRRSKTPMPQQLREWFAQRGASRGSVRCPYVICTGDRAGPTCGKFHSQHFCFSRLGDAWRAKFGDEAERPRWAELLRSGVDIFALDYDAILGAMYALSVSAEGDCYLRVPPDPGIEAAALGASEFAFPGSAPAEALHTFPLDSGASRCFFRDSTTLIPLLAPVPIRLADPSGGAVFARSSTVLPCPAVPSGSLSSFHLPSFSTSLPLAHVASCRTRLSFGTSALVTPPCHAFMACTPASLFLVFPGLCLPSRPRLTRPAFLASRGSNAPFLTPPRFPRRLLPCRLSTWTCGAQPVKGEVPDVLIPWIRAVPLQLRERFREDLPVLRLHSDRGGEFSSDLLWEFCRGEGILQSFTLLASLQQNGVAERHIGLVMEMARTSMVHAAAPHFLWPFAVRYAVHQLNLWPRVSLPETSPTLRWMRKVGDASVFRVWGSHAFVRDTSADKLSSCAVPCVFHGFRPDAPGWQFYHPTSRRVIPSQDVMFDEPGLAPSGVSQVDPLPRTVPVEVAVESGVARGAASGGAPSGGAEPASAEPGGAEPKGAEPGGVEYEGAESGGA
ncbi:unnamed protein product [Closterium sp. NIES-53]